MRIFSLLIALIVLSYGSLLLRQRRAPFMNAAASSVLDEWMIAPAEAAANVSYSYSIQLSSVSVLGGDDNDSVNSALERRRYPLNATPRIVCLGKACPAPRDPSEQTTTTTTTARIVLNDDNGFLAQLQSGESASSSSSHSTSSFAPLPINQTMCKEQQRGSSPQQQQQASMPTCNSVHEMDIVSSLISNSLNLLGSGNFRVALLYHHHKKTAAVVLKVLRAELEFDRVTYHRHATDAIISSALTSSKAAIAAHAFCGQSIATQVADTTLGDEVRRMDRNNRTMVAVRVKYGRDVARALAKVHQITEHGVARFVHRDLKIDNVMLVKGVVKLNDFNDGQVLLYNTTSHSECRFRRPMWGKYFASSEELLERPLTHKVDIHSLGAILYSLVVSHFDKETLNLKRGRLPRVPRTNDKSIRTVLNLTLGCWSNNPENRPSARHVAEELGRVLKKLEPTW